MNKDMILMHQIMEEAHILMVGRNDKYGDSWKVLTLQSIANLVEMKMHRIARMNSQNLDPKILDEFTDGLNYCAMGIAALRKLEHEQSQSDNSSI